MHIYGRRRRRSHKLLAATIVVAVLAVLGGALGVSYAALKGPIDELQAQLTTEFQAGQKELQAGKSSLTQANAKHDATLVAEATAHFAAAKDRFLTAGSLADNSRLLRNLEQQPIAGDMARSHHTAVRGLVEMGAAISDAGRELADLDGQLIKTSSAGTKGRALLTALDQTRAGLAKVRPNLERAQKGAALVDVHVLPAGQQPTFLKARETLTTGLAGLDEFDRLYPILIDILGGNGVRTYLIEQVNPAELRPGGGFIGTYSVVRADHGSLTVVKSGNSYVLADPRPLPGQPGFVPQQDPLRDVIPAISWSFVDSNIYPDFPSNARAAQRFAQPRLGMTIDAVISIDYYVVAKMLDLTGPLAVPGYRRTVDANSFIQQIIELELTDNSAHKALLSAIAGPLMERVSALPADQWPSLISALNSLAAERHIQAYFTNDVVEQEIDRVGWSGSFNPTASRDYMMAIESNIGGGKVNYFLSRHYSVTLTRAAGVLHHRVSVDLVNNQPFSKDNIANYRAYGSLYAGGPVSSPSNNLIPATYPKPAPPAGMTLLEGWQPIVPCCGGHTQAMFEYDTSWQTDAKGTHEIYWQKQPGTIDDEIDVIWKDGSGNTYRTRGNLGQDRVITLTVTGVRLTPGHPAQASLPSLSLG